MKLTRKEINQLNRVCAKYTGYQLPEKVAEFYAEVENKFGVLIPLFPGNRLGHIYYKNEEEVENSRFCYSVYEGQVKNDYNFYFS
jgi:hypothetical protein